MLHETLVSSKRSKMLLIPFTFADKILQRKPIKFYIVMCMTYVLHMGTYFQQMSFFLTSITFLLQ